VTALLLAWLRAQAARLAVGAALAGGLFLVLHVHDRWVFAAGAASVQARWDADKAALERAELVARTRRDAENLAEAARQRTVNAAITKGYEDEIAALRRAGTAGRLRVGPAFCGGPAATAETEGPARGDAPDPGARLLPEPAARDIAALMQEMGEAAAAGRACQRFVRENGMAD